MCMVKVLREKRFQRVPRDFQQIRCAAKPERDEANQPR